MKVNFEKLADLYKEGRSVPVIASELNISQWTLYKAMRQAQIPRRSSAESNRLSFLSKPLTYKKKTIFKQRDWQLYTVGLMLYWAEGSKRGLNTIDFANSDPLMVKIFLEFMRSIYNISESKLRILLYCYPNQPTSELIEFWNHKTEISKNQFTKPYIRPDFDHAKIGRMPHGMVHIRYSDQRLFRQLIKDLEDFTNQMILR